MTTLLESFDRDLGNIPAQMFGKQREGKAAHISGANTARCKPPACAFEIPLNHWTGKAEDLCLRIPSHRSKLQQEYMPSYERAQLVNSEEDVVNASALRFTHPVHEAMSLVHPGDFTYLCEVIKGKEPTAGPTSGIGRVDRAYFKGYPTDRVAPGHSKNTMACLEFKRATVVNAEAFEDIIVTTNEAYQGRLEAAKEGDANHAQEEVDVDTLLSQATHYAIKFQTPFVALFDCHTLILLVMTEVEEKAGRGGNFTYMTIVEDPTKLRKAFLGFLLCAHLHGSGNGNWKTTRDSTNILEKASTLGNEPAGVRPSSGRPQRHAAQKRTYAERDSQGSSQEGMNDAAHKAAQIGAARRGEGRKPSSLAKSSSDLSTISTSSKDSGRSSRSSTASSRSSTASSAGNGHKKSHGPGSGVRPAPSISNVNKVSRQNVYAVPPVGTNTSEIPIRGNHDSTKKAATKK